MEGNQVLNLEAEEEEVVVVVKDATQTVEQALAPAPPSFAFDPHFHSIEENIDELERRIKAEERRYVSLIENCHYYEHCMTKDEF